MTEDNYTLRNACITCYKLDKHEETLLNNSKFTYIVYQEEKCPSTDRHHLQGYIEFKQMRFKALKAILPEGTHIEERKGTQKQAIDYCKKETSRINGPWEKGTPKKQGKRNDLEEVVHAIKEKATMKELIEDHTEVVAKYPRFIDLCRLEYAEDRNWKTNIIIYWGKPGTGKTRRVYEECPTVKMLTWTGHFMLGYNNEDNVLFDDFDEASMTLDMFLRLTDRYALTINVKGGERKWNPRNIYFTSNYDPHGWYDGNLAVQRRMTVVTEVVVPEVAIGNTKLSPTNC